MNVFLLFYDGSHTQFNNCSFESYSGLLIIIEGQYEYEYDFENIKEFILVNEYTLLYAIEHGYRVQPKCSSVQRGASPRVGFTIEYSKQ